MITDTRSGTGGGAMAKRSKGRSKADEDEDAELDEGWTNCPECDRKVKEDNLRKHLQKVHGFTKTKAMKIMGEVPKGRKGKVEGKGLGPLIAIGVIAIIVIASMLAYHQLNKEKSGPVFYIDRTNHDFGRFSAGETDTVSTTFTITNDGDEPLEIWGIETSCDCTVARLTIDGKQSPDFKQTSNPQWTGRLAPGKDATLYVSYDPNMYLNRGDIVRTVDMKTNDDTSPKVTVTLTGYVTD
jgi:hypothetical protein